MYSDQIWFDWSDASWKTGVTYSVYFCMTVSITIFGRVLQLFILYFPHRDVQLVGIVT